MPEDAWIGRRIGQYEITARIGAGGMGEVYRARDTRLARDVAVKFLPSDMARDPVRLERFEREARAVAAINHPNIVTVYSVEASDDARFLTMELVEGQTLSRLLDRGSLPLPRFLDVAIPLADALAAAHAKGIVHRDLKPANIMLDGHGRVKVLDFGLAKLRPGESEAPDDLSAMATRTAGEPLTGEGRVVGTTAYMSPEQAEGKPVDARSDIFSLGVVLYEMATGARPFSGETPASLISSILKDTPDSVTHRNRAVPRPLERVVMRCLAKDPERRFQTALDVRNELEELRHEIDSGELEREVLHPVARSRRRSRVIGGGILVVVVIASLAAVKWFSHRGAPSNVAPPVTLTRLTHQRDVVGEPAIAPDGQMVAFVAERDGKDEIYLQRVGGSKIIDLTDDPGADDDEPAFSPDGQSIAFHSAREGGGLYVMGATGESPRRVNGFGHNPCWSPDGKTLLFCRAGVGGPRSGPDANEVWTLDLATGKTRELLDRPVCHPVWSPSGRRIALWGQDNGQRDIWTMRSDGSDLQAVTDDPATDWRPMWSPDGAYLYFVSDRGGADNLWRVPIDETSGRPTGPPVAVTTTTSAIGTYSMSRDGRRIAASIYTYGFDLETTAFDPDRAVLVGKPTVAVSAAAGPAMDLSPDGKWIAYMSFGSQEDIFVVRIDGTGTRQLTHDAFRDRFPSFSPSGDRILFFSNRSGKYEVWTIRPDGGDLRQETDVPTGVVGPRWSPDGSRIVCTDAKGGNFIVPMAGATTPRGPADLQALPAFNGEDGTYFFAVGWSPDGKRIVGMLVRRDQATVGMATLSLESGTYKTLTRFQPDPSPIIAQYLPDGRRLLYMQHHRLMLLDETSGKEHEVPTPPLPPGDERVYYLGGGGRTLVETHVAFSVDVWLVDLGPER